MRWTLLLFAAFVGCSSPVSNGDDLQALINAGTGRQPGIIDFWYDPPLIDVPTTATVGDSVTIAVTTYLLGTCMAEGDTKVSIVDSILTVEPFDVLDLPPLQYGQYFCNSQLEVANHDVRIAFDEPGDVTVEIRGRYWPENEPWARQYKITVN